MDIQLTFKTCPCRKLIVSHSIPIKRTEISMKSLFKYQLNTTHLILRQ